MVLGILGFLGYKFKVQMDREHRQRMHEFKGQHMRPLLTLSAPRELWGAGFEESRIIPDSESNRRWHRKPTSRDKLDLLSPTERERDFVDFDNRAWERLFPELNISATTAPVAGETNKEQQQ